MRPEWRRWWLAGEAVATTVAPVRRASCTAARPTAPDPPWIRSVSPSATPSDTSAWYAVLTGMPIDAACSQLTSAGLRTSCAASATRWVA